MNNNYQRYNPMVEDSAGHIVTVSPTPLVLHSPNGKKVKLRGYVTIRDVRDRMFD